MKVIREILKDHYKYRKQIFKLAKADLIKTYKGAALGWAWAVIRPAITIATYYVAFSIGLRVSRPVGEYSYFLWLLAGISPWFYFSAVFTAGAGSIRKYSYLVTKIRYPVSTIPTIINLSHMTTHLVVLLVVMLIFILSGHAPDIYWLQLPLYILMLFLFSTAWSLFAGMISVLSKDFMHLVQSSTMVVFWMSGILYDAGAINNVFFKRVLHINPITIIVNGYRNAFINKVWFWERAREFRNFGIVFFVMVLLALWAYKKLVKEIPDVL